MGASPLPSHAMAPASDVMPVGDTSPRLEIGFQTIQFYPYRAGLAAPRLLTSSADHRFNGRLLSRLGFPNGSAVDPRTFLSVLPGCARDTIVRDVAHALAV
jgi:hypothetical protein